MPTPSKPVPIVGEPNATADPKVHDLLAELVSILTANVDRNNLKDGEVLTAKVGDGQVTKAKLAADALNAFLKLAVAGDLKLAFGRSAGFGGFNAAGDISTVTVAHGLGRIPVWAHAIQANGSHYANGVRVSCEIDGFDAANLVIGGTCIRQPIAPAVTADAWWVAIG